METFDRRLLLGGPLVDTARILQRHTRVVKLGVRVESNHLGAGRSTTEILGHALHILIDQVQRVILEHPAEPDIRCGSIDVRHRSTTRVERDRNVVNNHRDVLVRLKVSFRETPTLGLKVALSETEPVQP